MLKFSYAIQVPGADLAKRFGYNSNIAGNFSFKAKKNWIYGANGSFFFGNQIKEKGILDSLKTSTSSGAHTGFIIDQNGLPATVRLFERGFVVSLHFGKMVNVWAKNKNSGVVIYGGPSVIRHKIKIDDIGKQSPQLTTGYIKGYDRLTVGWGMHQFVGYVYLSDNRILNFFGGIELIQGFTKSWRSYDYDLMRKDTKQRTDLLYGIRAGWILPLYKKPVQHYYYY